MQVKVNIPLIYACITVNNCITTYTVLGLKFPSSAPAGKRKKNGYLCIFTL